MPPVVEFRAIRVPVRLNSDCRGAGERPSLHGFQLSSFLTSINPLQTTRFSWSMVRRKLPLDPAESAESMTEFLGGT